MKKRLLSTLLMLTLLVLMVSAMNITAWADGELIPVTIQEGDNIFVICQSLGLDFQSVKGTIMLLNGWETEDQMKTVHAGETVFFPRSSNVRLETTIEEKISSTYYAYQNPDDVAYYVVAYQIRGGDTIENIYASWGLRYEKFANLICLLNCIDNLNALEVGTVYYLPTTVIYSQIPVCTVLAHTMQWGETAYGVFRSYGIDYNQYAELLWRFNNGADLTKIALGDKLLIPQV